MATLIVSSFTPRADNGRGVRGVTIARAIARNEDVEIAYVEFDGSKPADGASRRAADPPAPPPCLARRSGAASSLRARASRGSRPRTRAGSRRSCATRRRELDGFDRVIAEGPIAAAALFPVEQKVPFIYNGANVESGFRGELQDGETARVRLPGAARVVRATPVPDVRRVVAPDAPRRRGGDRARARRSLSVRPQCRRRRCHRAGDARVGPAAPCSSPTSRTSRTRKRPSSSSGR